MTTVSTSAFYNSAISSMNTLRTQTDTLQEEISTGNSIQQSSDNPLGAAQMRTLATADTMSTADTANANAATANLNLTDTTLTSFANIVTQIQTLATQAANGTLTSDQQANIGTQIAAYQTDLVALANTKNASGNALFGGQGTGDAYSVDSSGNATYNGTASANSVSLGNGMSVTTGITGPDFLNYTSGGAATNLLTVVSNLAAALQGGSSDPTTAAKDALDSLSDGLNAISTAQTTVGARLNWVSTTSTIQTAISTQRSTDEANIGGTDITTAVSQLQQALTVLQASQATFVKIANTSLFSMLT